MSNETLVSNLQDQLVRLVEQLKDIEEERINLDASEYAEMKADTMDQLKELSASLEKMEGGDMSVIDSLTATKMAVRSAISHAFRTPEVISLFAKKQPAILRQRLFQVETDFKLRKVEQEGYIAKKVEILHALQSLRDDLSPDELLFLNTHGKDPSFQLEVVSGNTTCKNLHIS